MHAVVSVDGFIADAEDIRPDCHVRGLVGVFMPDNSKRPGGHHDHLTCFEGADPERTP